MAGGIQKHYCLILDFDSLEADVDGDALLPFELALISDPGILEGLFIHLFGFLFVFVQLLLRYLA
jgi:hypothetical protein